MVIHPVRSSPYIFAISLFALAFSCWTDFLPACFPPPPVPPYMRRPSGICVDGWTFYFPYEPGKNVGYYRGLAEVGATGATDKDIRIDSNGVRSEPDEVTLTWPDDTTPVTGPGSYPCRAKWDDSAVIPSDETGNRKDGPLVKSVKLVIYACYVTLYADQPGSGGDDDIWEGSIWSPDIGHSFFKFDLVPAEAVDYVVPDDDLNVFLGSEFGFYPAEGISKTNKSCAGILVDDSGHHYEASHTWTISKDGLNSGLYTLHYWKDIGAPIYDLDDFNCTDAAVEVGTDAGISPPDPQGSVWPYFSGSNPGMFGYALSQLE